jgi:ATP-binding cassette subfamily C protein
MVIVGALVLKSALVLFARKRIGYTVAHVGTDHRLALLKALVAARWEYYVRQPVGALVNAVATEAHRTSEAYLHGATLASLAIQAAVYTGVALLVSAKATVAALGVAAVVLLLSSRLIRKARRAGERQTNRFRSLTSLLTDTLNSVKPLKAMGREAQADALLQLETAQLHKALQKKVFAKEFLKALQEPMFVGMMAIGLYLALARWNMPLASVIVLVILLARVLGHLGKVQREYQEMVSAESAYWSLKASIEKASREREPSLGGVAPSLAEAIRFDRVSFSYGEGGVFRDLSLRIPAGSFTAIVGPSGAGKTTVVDLITALLRPQEGEIWIDDVPMAQVDLRRWRQMMGYVPQETLLLHDSILMNVTLGDPKLSEQDAERALRAAGAWEFVAAMPQGIHSTVGERGGMISGGQRQRIAIARALVHNPKLLILDEPTTALDPENENAICDTLTSLRGELTVLAISHQPALVNAADQVYRLEEGDAVLTLDRPQSPGSKENGLEWVHGAPDAGATATGASR